MAIHYSGHRLFLRERFAKRCTFTSMGTWPSRAGVVVRATASCPRDRCWCRAFVFGAWPTMAQPADRPRLADEHRRAELTQVSRQSGQTSTSSGMVPARLVLAVRCTFTRAGLRNLVERTPGMVVLAETPVIAQAIALCTQHHADLLVVDADCTNPDGIAAVQRFSQAIPDVPVIAVIEANNLGMARRVLRAGATDYLVRDAPEEHIIGTLQRASLPRGSTVYLPIAGPLTTRELEILRGVAQGKTNPEIGEELGISVNTVRVHLAKIRSKLRAKGRTEVVKRALELGLFARRNV